MELLQIYDRNHNKILGLKDFKDLKIESVLSTGDKSLSFLYTSKYSSYLENEGYIRTKENEYVIKTIDETNDWYSVDATLNLEDLEGNAFESFDSTEETIQKCIQLAIAGTGWTVNVIDNINKKRTVRKTDSTVIDILQEIRKTYLVEIEYDTLNKVIKVYEKLGKDKGCYFMDSLNLKQLDVNKDSYDFYTKIIAIGATDEDTKTTLKVTVNNNQYSNKAKTLLWKDERYTVESSLREDATAKLEELSKPRISYKADIYDLANLNIKYKDVLDYSLGDTVTLIDKEKGIKEKQRIVKIEEYPNEPEKNNCELSNAVYTFEDIMKSQHTVESTVNNITSDDGTISPDAIRSTLVKMINVDIQNLNAVSAKIGELFTNILTADVANIETGIVGKLLAKKIEADDLVASTIKFNIAEGGSMSLLDLLSQFVSAENLQALHLTSGNVVIDEAVIKDLIAAKIKVSDLLAGNIDSERFNIVSKNGNLIIKDNTIQIKDSNRVRIQIGKDASGDYTLNAWDKNGNLLFNSNGITEDAIKNPIIRDDMVADNAGIKATKLNIESLFETINNDKTHTLNSSIVELDGTEQTIDVAFKKINSSMLYNQAVGTYYGHTWNITTTETEGKINITHILYKVLSNKMKVGSKVKVSFDLAGKNLVCKKNDSKLIVFQGSGDVTGWNAGSWYGYNILRYSDVMPDEINEHYEYSFTVDSNHIKNNYWTLNLRVDRIDGDFSLSNLMIQVDEPFVDFWTKSTYDDEDSINTLQTEFNVQQGQINQLIKDTTITEDGVEKTFKDAYNETKSKVDGTVQTVTNMQTTINSINTPNLIPYGGRNYIDVAKWDKTNFTAEDSLSIDGMWYKILNYTAGNGLYVTNSYAVTAPTDKIISLGFSYYCNNDNWTLDKIKNVRVYILQELNNSNNFYNNYKMIELNKTLTAKRFGQTITLHSQCTRYKLRFDLINEDDLGEVSCTALRIGDITIVNGEIPLKDWSPALADIETNITDQEQRINRCTVKTTDEAFTVQVQKNQNRVFNIRYIRDYMNGSNTSTANVWTDVQALLNNGGNACYNKTVTGSCTINNPENIVDWSTSTYSTSSNTGLQYITIDLGQIYSNVDEIKVFHATDGRICNSTKTEVSADGTNWVTLFDSAVSGTYQETVYGHSIKVNGTSFNSSQVTINELGEQIYNGALRIYNKAGTEVFGADTNGNLKMLGIVEQRDPATGYLATALKHNGLGVYDWRRRNDLVGGIVATEMDSSKRGTATLFADKGNILAIGYRDGTGLEEDFSGSHFKYVITIDDMAQQDPGYITSFYQSMAFHNTPAFKNGAEFENTSKYFDYASSEYFGNDHDIFLGEIYTSTSNNFCIMSNGSHGNVNIGTYRNGGYYTTLQVDNGGITVHGNLQVNGNKNRVVDTINYGKVGLNAYETSGAYFGDIGRATLDDDGVCYVYLDEIFKETGNTKIQYEVFLTIYGNEENTLEELNKLCCYCIKQTEDYFLLKGTPGIEVGWEVKCKQKGYEKNRLDSIKNTNNQTYDNLLEQNDKNYKGKDNEKYKENIYEYLIKDI